MIHGGPTDAARPVLQMALQFWTTRGFAVVEVNYGGSTGFGRNYRERLNGAWGIVDVEDCANAVQAVRDERVAGTQGLLPDGKRSARRVQGLLEPPLLEQEAGDIGEAGRHCSVLGAQDGLAQCQ